MTRMAAERFDIAIIGGGSTGMGAALDAASRGLSVALIEQRDIASGTSSRSSKLIHGGLRYLERFDFRLVREALAERGLLLTKLAPHLVYPRWPRTPATGGSAKCPGGGCAASWRRPGPW